MTDTTLTDLAPFFERYEHRQRLVFVAALSASLVLSAVIVAHGVLTNGAIGPKPVAAMWGVGVVFPPFFTVGWWTFTELMARARRRASSPDGRHPASTDDARNGVRIANAGFVYNIGLTAAVIGTQATLALLAFGHPVGDLIPRATTVALGAVTIYLGNLWPRLPTSRAPTQKAARRMKALRLGGWVMVISGLLIVLLGLFMPLLYPHLRGHHP